MATKKKANAAYLAKEPSAVHESFANYIEATTGVEIDSATVGLVQRLYPLYLKSPSVALARETERTQRQAAKAQRDIEKKERLQARLDKIEAQRAKVLASLGLDAQPVVDATDRFVTTSDEGLTFAAADDEDEDEGVEVVEGEVEPEDDEEEWGDDDDEDEEDF